MCCERCGCESSHATWCYKLTLNALAAQDCPPAPKLDHYDQEPPF